MRRLLPLSVLALAACNPLKTTDPRFDEGIGLYDDSKWADAAAVFDQVVSEEPSSEGHFNRGMSLYRQDKLGEAAEDFRRTLTSKDEKVRARAWLDVGNAEAKQGQLDNAIKSYRRSLELVPDDPDALYNLEWAQLAKSQQKKDQKGGDDSQEKDGEKDDEKNEGDGKDDDGEQQAKNDSKKPGEKEEQGDDGKKQGDEQKADQSQADNQQQDGTKEGDQGKGEGEKEQEQEGATAESQQEKGEEGEQGQAGAAGQQGEEGDEKEGLAKAKPLDAQEIDEVLDSLQASEKNLQMWKFQQQKADQRRRPGGKDW